MELTIESLIELSHLSSQRLSMSNMGLDRRNSSLGECITMQARYQHPGDYYAHYTHDLLYGGTMENRMGTTIS